MDQWKKNAEMTQFDQIIAYEQGELSHPEIVELFQDLLDTGLCWKLQGHYGRTAKHLIESGLISLPGKDKDHGNLSDI